MFNECLGWKSDEKLLIFCILNFSFNSLLGVSSGDETLRLMFYILHEDWDRRPMWITASEIWTILDIIQKPYSIIILLFIQNISKFFIATLAPRRWKRNRSVTPAPAPLGFLKRGSFLSCLSTVMCHFSVLELLDSVLNFAKNVDEDGIRTHACRAHWISSPTP